MKKTIRFTVPVIALALMSIAPAFVHAQASEKTNQSQNAAVEWNTPPAGTEQAQQGFRDGIEAAQLDQIGRASCRERV